MAVGGRDHADAVGVEALCRLQAQARLEGVAHVAAGGLAVGVGPAQLAVENLEVRPLVVRGQHRMGLGLALDLVHLADGLVAQPQLRVGGVERFAGSVHVAVHLAVAAVGVVGDGNQVVAGLARPLHPGPEVLRIGRVDDGEGPGGDVGAAEDHVAVQVLAFGHRGVLVGHEGGELARPVVAVGQFDEVAPGRLDHLVGDQLGQGHAGVERLHERAERGPGDGGVRAEEVADQLDLVERALGIVDRRRDAHVVAVLGQGHEVERRSLHLDLPAGDVVDGLAAGVAVGLVGSDRHLGGVGVEGPARVDVQVPEVGLLQRVAGDFCLRVGGGRGFLPLRLRIRRRPAVRGTGEEPADDGERPEAIPESGHLESSRRARRPHLARLGAALHLARKRPAAASAKPQPL